MRVSPDASDVHTLRLESCEYSDQMTILIAGLDTYFLSVIYRFAALIFFIFF